MQTDTRILPTKRLRRNRKSAAIRALVQETHVGTAQLVAPLFVQEGKNQKIPIKSLPETYRLSIDLLVQEVKELYALGIQSVNLFCYIPQEKRDPIGSEAVRAHNLLQQAIFSLKDTLPDLLVMADVALDPFTSHGHDGLVDDKGYVLNDETLEVLCEMSLRAAEAGCDVISPSDMMDGRVRAIRNALDIHGFTQVSILSYAAKYTSSLYGPFRDVLDSSPKFGDKKGYQLNPANIREALLECALDEEEGADMLLIKPAITNLDVIAKVRAQTNLPIGAYQVSGEWAMIQAAKSLGFASEIPLLLEMLTSIRRAGADFIFTYGAKKVAKELRCGLVA